MTELTGKVGFASPTLEGKFSTRRRAGVELIATVALAISLIIAGIAVSIGVARAQALDAVTGSDGASLGIAILFGLLLAGMGGLTALAARGRRSQGS
jgi:Na+/glutamate symporter